MTAYGMDRRAKFKLRSLERNQSAPTFMTGKKSGHDKQDLFLAASKMGHDLRKRTFYKLTSCQHCAEVLWGLKGQGYQCTGEHLALRSLAPKRMRRVHWPRGSAI